MALSGHASQPSIYLSTIILTIVSCVAVILRLITRLAIVKKCGVEEALIVVACVSLKDRSTTGLEQLTVMQVLSVLMGVSICKQGTFSPSSHGRLSC
jgi:hypothetical protein